MAAPQFNLATHFAEGLRAAGRDHVLKKEFNEAVATYTEATLAFGRAGFPLGVGVCLTNRAIVLAKLGCWAEAYCDAATAVKYAPKFAKGWYRGAVALEHLGHFRAAGTMYYRALANISIRKERGETALKLLTAAAEAPRDAEAQAERQHDAESRAERESGPRLVSKPVASAAQKPVVSAAQTANDATAAGSEAPRLWFGLGPGRCGLHSLAALANSRGPRACAAACLSTAPDHRSLLWDPGESRSDVVRRKICYMRKLGAKAQAAGDVNHAWLPYVGEILAQCGDAKFVASLCKVLGVVRREKRANVESWFSWTEAGSARSTLSHGNVPVEVDARSPWQLKGGDEFVFDDRDLTMPKFDAATKRESLEMYYDFYEETVADWSKRYPNNFKTVDVETFFQDAALQADLFQFLGVKASDQDGASKAFFHEHKQRYLYDVPERESPEGFLRGDFAQDMATQDEVPEGAQAGDKIRFVARGRPCAATVPAGLSAGDVFFVPHEDEEEESSPWSAAPPPPAAVLSKQGSLPPPHAFLQRVAKLDDAGISEADVLDDID
ncbi:hypothetical protein M885DRAFT_502682 [Pelagophyceae sp. CCMP2097]|nr:hypothetical protein M885DRAFT_502682 [Pelagophyceae sp. CCMP2097]